MSDYDKYAAALQQQALNNSASQLGGFSDSLATSAFQIGANNPDQRGEALLYAGILGALSGGLGAYGQNIGMNDYANSVGVLTGKTQGQPDGLSNSLYKQALTYKDLIAKGRAEQRAMDWQKEVDKKTIETNFIGRQEAARELAKRMNNLPLSGGIGDKGRAGTIGSSGGAIEGDEKKVGAEGVAEVISDPSESMSMVDPLTDLKGSVRKAQIADNIGSRIAMMPSEQQSIARTELGKIQKMNDLLDTVEETVETAYQNTNAMQEVDNMLPFGWDLPNLTSESRQKDAARTGIVAAVRPLWGSISADDIPIIIDSFMPKYGESREEVEYKKAKLRQILVANTDPTPVLEMNGLVDRPNVGIPIQGGRDVMTPQQQIEMMAREAKARGLTEAQTKEEIRLHFQKQTIPSTGNKIPIG